jgi:hypothetical protein
MTTRRDVLAGAAVIVAGTGLPVSVGAIEVTEEYSDKYWEAQAKIDALELEIHRLNQETPLVKGISD